MKKWQISFQRLLIIALAAFLAFGITISFVVSSSYSRRMWLRQRDNTLSSFSVASEQITSLLMTARQTAILAQSNEAVIEYLWGVFDSRAAQISAFRTMGSYLTEVMNKNNSLQGLFFAKDDGSLYGMTLDKLYLSSEPGHPFVKELDALQLASDETVWIAPLQLRDLSQNQATSISMSNTLALGVIHSHLSFSYHSIPQVLTTLAAVNIDSLRHCFDYLSTADEPVFLVNQEGECVALSGTAWKQGVIDCWPAIDTVQTEGSSIWDSPDHGKTYIVHQVIPLTHWYLVKMIPMELFERDIIQLRITTIISTLTLLGVLIAMYAVWLRRLTKSLNLIIHAMEQMRNGELSARILNTSDVSEFELIRTQFNDMADSIERLMNRTRIMEHNRVTLEATSLRTQLSPHMIFNSIASIRWMAVILNQKSIANMLGELAELLRPVFREWRLTWSLREEIAHLNHYINLLQLRCGGMLDISMLIPEDLMDCEVPCFVLQPILENSFEHGMRPSERFHISLKADREDDGLFRIEVKDEGAGIPPEELARLRARLTEAEKEGYMPHGIGLSNVHRKIRLLFGENSGVVIDSVEGQGTTVTLNIYGNVK